MSKFKQHHELKLSEKFYYENRRGEKPFEVRKNDRDYKVGDEITFRLAGDEGLMMPTTTGWEIGYILHDTDFPEGIKEGYCVFSIKPHQRIIDKALKAQARTIVALAEALRYITNKMTQDVDRIYCTGQKVGHAQLLNNPREMKLDAEFLQKALTQHEALIKQSEAVWAVVEKAKMWNRHPEGSKDSELSDAVEALEMMEEQS